MTILSNSLLHAAPFFVMDSGFIFNSGKDYCLSDTLKIQR